MAGDTARRAALQATDRRTCGQRRAPRRRGLLPAGASQATGCGIGCTVPTVAAPKVEVPPWGSRRGVRVAAAARRETARNRRGFREEGPRVSGERRAAIPPTAGAASPPLLRRLAGPAFWSTLGAGASRILAVGAAILVARELGAAGFGELNLVQTTAGMLMALGGFGLNTTATKLLAGKYRADPLGAGRVIVLSGAMSVAVGSVTAVLLVANAGWVAREVLAAPQLEPALVVAALLLVVSPLTGTQIGVLMGLERFRSIAVVNTAAAAASIPLLVVGTRLAGMLGAVAATVATALRTAGIQWVAVGRAMRAAGIRLAAREAVREWRLLFSYSVPLTLSNVLLAPVAWATSALIAHQAEGLSELGLFAAANQWRNAIVLLATSAGAVVFPLFSHLHDSGRPRSFARAFWTSAGVTGGAALLVAAILAVQNARAKE